MTELEVQKAIYRNYYRTGYKFFIPNIYLFDWESDLLGVNTSDYLIEYEVKVTRADFKNDMKKKERHFTLETGLKRKYRREWNFKNKKYEILETAEVKANRPNKFYYVCPKGVIKKEDVPSYCGLIYLDDRYLRQIKAAPFLHKRKINDKFYKKVFLSVVCRFTELKFKEV